MKNKKNLIIVSMMAIVAVMAIGYAYFATRLNINATGNITSNWNVYFSNITSGTITGSASNASTPSVSGTTANMEANLQLPGDSMTYELTLTNAGTIGAIIENIEAKSEGSSAIIYSINGLKIGDKLAGGENKVITIKIEYDPNVTSQPVETSKTLTVTIDAVQDIGQSITLSDPVIEGELGNFARAILSNNNVQSDENIDFSKGSRYVSSYKEVHEESTASVSMSSSSTYYYGSGYIFDEAKGTYSLTGTTSGTWSTMSTNYANYPYTCKYTNTNTNSCTTLYKMTGYTSATAGVGYKYTREAVYSDNGKGLFYTNKNTEENKSTYYFRGNVKNNYVSFGRYQVGYSYDDWDAGEYVEVEAGGEIIWRIVRINEDGSIRLIADDWRSLPMSSYSDEGWDNAHAGYMYGTTGAMGDNAYVLTHANTTNSTIKTTLDTWYNTHLSSYANLFAQDAGFCNDRSVSPTANTWNSDDTALGYGDNTTYYGSHHRIYNLSQPQFKCPQTNDLFTLTTSSKGNKVLTKPIGTITVDEMIYAGDSVELSGAYYMDNGQTWWTMTPYNFNGGINAWEGGNLIKGNCMNSVWVRPVINLKENVDFTLEGTGEPGSATNPYVIKTN